MYGRSRYMHIYLYAWETKVIKDSAGSAPADWYILNTTFPIAEMHAIAKERLSTSRSLLWGARHLGETCNSPDVAGKQPDVTLCHPYAAERRHREVEWLPGYSVTVAKPTTCSKQNMKLSQYRTPGQTLGTLGFGELITSTRNVTCPLKHVRRS